jgi:hypothetical protein
MKKQLVAREIFQSTDPQTRKQNLTAKINSYLQARLANWLKR